MPGLEFALPIALGISLAAATGFRVFAPLLIMGLAVNTGFLPVSDGFEWVGTGPALIMLAIAAIAEVAGYYVPGIDNLLDTVATPAAVIAGIAASAAVMTDVPPMLKWTLAIIAGGGAASITQGATTLLRGHSTAWTAGLGNHAIATGEIVGAIGISLLALVAPWLALVIAIAFCWIIWRIWRRFRGKTEPPSA
jgi:hypothetical protein